MSIRILLIIVGVVSMVFGLFFLLAPEMAIEEFQVGTADAPLRLTIRELGGALISLAVINWLSVGDKGTKVLRGVAAGNILFFLFNTGLDFTESFPKTGLWYAVTVLKVAFILALSYSLLASKGRQVMEREPGGDRISRA